MTFKVQASLTGIHSRSEQTARTSRDFDRGRASADALNEAFEDDAKNLVSLQRASGFYNLSDGQLRWQDFIRPFAESLSGLRQGADLSRWFDTNSFYRKPFVVGKISLENAGFLAKKYTEKPAFRGSKKKKISLPGPYTLASLVEDQTYGSRTELVVVFAEILQKIISNLGSNGYSCVQLNEPALVYRYGESALTNKTHLEAFIDAFSRSLSRTRAELYLHTYFGDCSSILADLVKLKGVSTVGVDFTQTSLADIETIKFGDKALGCGCVDGRNSLVETSVWISKFCADAVKTVKPAGLVILPSSDLKYLPREYADRKIKAIGSATKIARKQLLRFGA
jgi:5-methyltetrahydropteroyltriglutamate--homocysteine methyltransferase